MALFVNYQRSNPVSLPHIRWVQKLGLIPIFITGALIAANRTSAGPGLWTALGLSLGLELILWGALELYSTHEKKTPWGEELVRRHDRWFPTLVFVMKYSFIALSLTVLWMTIHDLGFPTSLWHHILFVFIVLLLPITQAVREKAGADPEPRVEAWDNICHCLNVILITIVVASLLCNLIVSQSSPYGTETDPLVLVIWVLAILIMISSMIIYLGRIARHKRPAPRWRHRENAPGSATKF
jgi:O-antigen/teichoic acid export membrane protein